MGVPPSMKQAASLNLPTDVLRRNALPSMIGMSRWLSRYVNTRAFPAAAAVTEVTAVDPWLAFFKPYFDDITGALEGLIDNAAFASAPSTDVKIPSTIDGVDVETIGNNLFEYNTLITSVSIPDSVTSIGNYSFRETSSAQSITFGPGSLLGSIADWTFFDAGLTSIAIPDNVTSIGFGSFYGAFALTDVTFGTGSLLTSIDNYAFKSAPLTSIAIPDKVTSIGSNCFSNCIHLDIVTFGPSSLLETINAYAFYQNGFTSITIPSGVTAIKASAFNACTSLTNVWFKNKTPPGTIGDDVFLGTNVTKIYVGTVVGDGAAFFNDLVAQVGGIGNLPTWPQLIGDYEDGPL